MKKVIEELEQSKVQILKLISKKLKDNDVIKLSRKHLNFINDIESLRGLAIEWYMENI